MLSTLSLLVVLAVPPVDIAPSPPAEAAPAVEAQAPLDSALFVANNCFIRCDNGISLDTQVSSCEECASIAYANCNQQGTFGGYFWGPACSDFW